MPFSNNLLAGAASASGGVSLVEVGNSALFDAANTEYLTWSPGSASDDQDRWTFSTWIFRGAKAGEQRIFGGQANACHLYFDSDQHLVFDLADTGSSSATGSLHTSQVFRDYTGWYHIVAVVNTASATSSLAGASTDRMRLYVNGSQITSFGSNTVPGQNYNSCIGDAGEEHSIGYRTSTQGSAGMAADFYMAETVFQDDVASLPTAFGEFDETGLYWTPKSSDDIKTLTFGTNGFYLPFDDSANPGADASPGQTAAGADVTVAFQSSAVSTSGLTEYTFSAQTIGADTTSHKVVIAASAGNNPATVTSCTVDGQSATVIAQAQASGDHTTLLEVDGITATSGDIVITFSGVQNRAGCAAWDVRNAGTAYESVTETNDTVLNGALSIPRGGAMIGCAVTHGTATHTWAGVTENYDETIFTATKQSGGSLAYSAGQSNTTVSCTPSATNTNDGFVAASFPRVGDEKSFINNNTVVTSTHTPTNSYAVMSPVHIWGTYSSNDFSNGNLNLDNIQNAYDKNLSTLCTPSTGKWGFQYTINGVVGGGEDAYLGWVADPANFTGMNNGPNKANYSAGTHFAGDQLYKNGVGVGSSSLTRLADNDVVEMLLDVDAGTCDVLLNAVAYGAQITGLTAASYFVCLEAYDIGADFDFGQLGYTPSDSNYLALNTTNIAASTTRTVSDVYEHWANLIWSGNSGSQTIDISAQTPNGSDFTPDWTMIKSRSFANGANIFDVVRGPTKGIATFDSGEEDTNAHTGSLFSAGQLAFSGAGDTGDINNSGRTYVGWTAKLGGSAVSNTDGTITSSVSVNTTLGMSVGTYTGTGSNATIGHGLGTVPEFIMSKPTSGGAGSWYCYHVGYGATKYTQLNWPNGAAVESNVWNDTEPTSSVWSVGTGDTNGSGRDFIFIAFAPSEFISIGSYEGNASTDGTFVPTINSAGVPLMPIYHLAKNIDFSDSWNIMDVARSSYNLTDAMLSPNAAAAEVTGADRKVDFVSGGIKERGADTALNAAYTYLHLTIGIPMIDTDGRILGGR